jgi:hypothetical protein
MPFGTALTEVIHVAIDGVELMELGARAGAGRVRGPGELELGGRHVAYLDHLGPVDLDVVGGCDIRHVSSVGSDRLRAASTGDGLT